MIDLKEGDEIAIVSGTLYSVEHFPSLKQKHKPKVVDKHGLSDEPIKVIKVTSKTIQIEKRDSSGYQRIGREEFGRLVKHPYMYGIKRVYTLNEPEYIEKAVELVEKAIEDSRVQCIEILEKSLSNLKEWDD